MIVGITLESIEAKKYGKFDGNIRIDNNVSITGVKELKIPLFEEKISQIAFGFTTKYVKEKEELGDILIKGVVLYRGEEENIRKSYASEKKLPEKIGPIVVNAILTKCITRTIDLAEQLALPPPINFPVVSHKKKQNLEYIG